MEVKTVAKTRLGIKLEAIEKLKNRFDKQKEKVKTEEHTMMKSAAKRVAKRVLGELYERLAVTPSEQLKDEVIELVRDKSDEIKLAIVYFLGRTGYDPGDRPSPEACKTCGPALRTINKLKLGGYLRNPTYNGDWIVIPEEVFENALTKCGMIHQEILRELEVLDTKQKALATIEETTKVRRLLEKSGVDYEELEKAMPDFIEFLKQIMKRGKSGVACVTIEAADKVGVIITDESAWYGNSGIERGARVILYRNGEVKEEYFKYRDPYSQSADRWDLQFDRVEIVEITEDKVIVRLQAGEEGKPVTRTYEIRPSEKPIIDAKAFIAHLEKVKEELIERHWRKGATYFRRLSYAAARAASGLPDATIMGMDDEVPYDKPKIISEHVRTDKGEAVLIVESQIDALPAAGKQYEWVAYLVTMEGVKEITRECAYEEELTEFGGRKTIRMKASEVYAEHAKQK